MKARMSADVQLRLWTLYCQLAEVDSSGEDEVALNGVYSTKRKGVCGDRHTVSRFGVRLVVAILATNIEKAILWR